MRLHAAILQAEVWPSRRFGDAQMLYVVLLEDSVSSGPDIRRQHMPAHLSFLEKKQRGSRPPDRYERYQVILPAGSGSLKQNTLMSSTRS